MQAPTLKALEIVAVIRSRIKPPASVPAIPQTIVTPPKIKSALLWKTIQDHIRMDANNIIYPFVFFLVFGYFESNYCATKQLN